MQPQFNVTVLEMKTVYDVPEVWTEAVYLAVLGQVEFDDVNDVEQADLPEMAVMALQDLEAEEAAAAVLAVLLADRLNAGVRQNLVHELKEQRLWEVYASLNCHADLFQTAVLLNKAFPKTYPRPDCLRLVLRVLGANSQAAKLLADEPHPAWIVRLVAAGMDHGSTLHRLYGDQVKGAPFPEAAGIIWRATIRDRSGTDDRPVVEWVIYSSQYWLKGLKGVRDFEATISADRSK